MANLPQPDARTVLDELTSLQQAPSSMEDLGVHGQGSAEVPVMNVGAQDSPSLYNDTFERRNSDGLPVGGKTDDFDIDSVRLSNEEIAVRGGSIVTVGNSVTTNEAFNNNSESEVVKLVGNNIASFRSSGQLQTAITQPSQVNEEFVVASVIDASVQSPTQTQTPIPVVEPEPSGTTTVTLGENSGVQTPQEPQPEDPQPPVDPEPEDPQPPVDPEPEDPQPPVDPEPEDPPEEIVKENNGHGNNIDGEDDSNPGKGNGGPNDNKDPVDEDEASKGNTDDKNPGSEENKQEGNIGQNEPEYLNDVLDLSSIFSKGKIKEIDLDDWIKIMDNGTDLSVQVDLHNAKGNRSSGWVELTSIEDAAGKDMYFDPTKMTLDFQSSPGEWTVENQTPETNGI